MNSQIRNEIVKFFWERSIIINIFSNFKIQNRNIQWLKELIVLLWNIIAKIINISEHNSSQKNEINNKITETSNQMKLTCNILITKKGNKKIQE